VLVVFTLMNKAAAIWGLVWPSAMSRRTSRSRRVSRYGSLAAGRVELWRWGSLGEGQPCPAGEPLDLPSQGGRPELQGGLVGVAEHSGGRRARASSGEQGLGLAPAGVGGRAGFRAESRRRGGHLLLVKPASYCALG
jgi:hypothetical protein